MLEMEPHSRGGYCPCSIYTAMVGNRTVVKIHFEENDCLLTLNTYQPIFGSGRIFFELFEN